MSEHIPRPEYPRPQMVRPNWMNLNGTWEFEIDHGKSGRARGLNRGSALAGQITVPFCPESTLSGVGYKDFMASVWYRRVFTLPASWETDRVLLHFGAVDYDAEVFVNGVSAGRHQGGYASFSFDITDRLVPGENTLVLCAEDDNRSGLQPRGKQSSQYHSHGCDYTRTTGIWQTVWLESVPGTYLQRVRYVPDPANAVLHVEALLNRPAAGGTLTASASFCGNPVGTAAAIVTGNRCRLSVSLTECHLWEPGSPNLHDLVLTLSGTTTAGETLSDKVDSYFGLRSVSWDGNSIQINGKSVFQRLILDQGFWPDGIYTAPADDELRRDIERGMVMGFNGARMHEKIFEARYLYWADRLGYLVWGEQANWGLDITGPKGLAQFLPEWLESVARDFNSPALVGWCPFNETWDEKRADGTGSIPQDDDVLRQVYQVTKALDPTRPVIDTSGNYHVMTDIFDIHDYEQDVAAFAAKFADMRNGGRMLPNGCMEKWGTVFNTYPERQRYEGQPYFVSEYGGIWWNPAQVGTASWGYGARPGTEEEFLARFAGLTDTLLDNPNICALCYTQLTDVEQETNGLYTYEREPKFDPGVIRAIVSRKAAIEG